MTNDWEKDFARIKSTEQPRQPDLPPTLDSKLPSFPPLPQRARRAINPVGQPTPSVATPVSTAVTPSSKPWVVLALAVIYLISPYDLIGGDDSNFSHLDDGLVVAYALLNVWQKNYLPANDPGAKLIKRVKILIAALIALIVVVFLFLLGGIALIIKALLAH